MTTEKIEKIRTLLGTRNNYIRDGKIVTVMVGIYILSVCSHISFPAFYPYNSAAGSLLLAHNAQHSTSIYFED